MKLHAYSFKNLVNRFIIEIPKIVSAAGKGSCSKAKQRGQTPELAHWVKMMVDHAVVVEIFLLKNLPESLILIFSLETS